MFKGNEIIAGQRMRKDVGFFANRKAGAVFEKWERKSRSDIEPDELRASASGKHAHISRSKRLTRGEFANKHRSDLGLVVECLEDVNAINRCIPKIGHEDIDTGFAAGVDFFDKPSFDFQVLDILSGDSDHQEYDGDEAAKEQHQTALTGINRRDTKANHKESEQPPLPAKGETGV